MGGGCDDIESASARSSRYSNSMNDNVAKSPNTLQASNYNFFVSCNARVVGTIRKSQCSNNIVQRLVWAQ